MDRPRPGCFAAGLNLYSYGAGNPVNYVDLNGELVFITTTLIVWDTMGLGFKFHVYPMMEPA